VLVLVVLLLRVVYVVYVYVIGCVIGFLFGIKTSLSSSRGFDDCARTVTLFFLFSLRSSTASKVHRVHGPFPLPLIELVRFDVVASFAVLDV